MLVIFFQLKCFGAQPLFRRSFAELEASKKSTKYMKQIKNYSNDSSDSDVRYSNICQSNKVKHTKHDDIYAENGRFL